MVAQRATATTTRRASSTKAVKRQVNSGDGGDSGRDPAAAEVALLQAMRADALAWLAEIERRIEALTMKEGI